MIKPMLAATIDLNKLVYPIMISPKIDGIRCLIMQGKALSRSLKLLPNEHLQNIAKTLPHGLDCEITVGPPTGMNVMQATSSGVMSVSGEPDFQFHIIDVWNMPEFSAKYRYERAKNLASLGYSLFLVKQEIIDNEDDLRIALDQYLALGYEGLMAKRISSLYKYGRSTVKEGSLLKYKLWADDYFKIIGYNELLHNDNEPFEGELGQLKRQSLQENMLGMNTLGSLTVSNAEWTTPFSVGTGFDACTRQELWDKRDSLIGKEIKVKYFETGVKDAPRFPVYLGMRGEHDV